MKNPMFGLYRIIQRRGRLYVFGKSDFMVENEMHAHMIIIARIISQDKCRGYSVGMILHLTELQ